ncbi:MAG: hypothetical protein CME24_21345 [Gemmatimonadetes bacterium]|nr:hypothetical protein [Gemmatimonadota bacterium]
MMKICRQIAYLIVATGSMALAGPGESGAFQERVVVVDILTFFASAQNMVPDSSSIAAPFYTSISWTSSRRCRSSISAASVPTRGAR